eukprot:CAMPEP_0172499412 /NCGR_PEP_ID=MMETSP1066-20121228/126853_1 /TAXON_ID=671091 /ORGANISM="Coscinodiscus wailesii, Strain CCMP2513" /LENGTH=386 /DNA_ID=CAMNT_0013273147 /DNA_START=118 /DNA_END=1278 /DNA_ORIENTATION=+
MGVKNLLSQSKEISGRRLKDDEYPFDLSSYSVRFGKCQYVKSYSDEVALDYDSEDVFAMKHFVVYRLCPNDECSTCDENYGEYVVKVDDYLQAMANYYKEEFENSCKACNNNCDDDGNGNGNYNDDESGYCGDCMDKCNKYDNMEENGYVDASDYIECQKLDIDFDDDYYNDDGDDGNGFVLYAGPRCSSDGQKIVIGLFTDEYCYEPYDEADIEELLGVDIVYYLLRNTYSDSDCATCKELDWDADQNDNNNNNNNGNDKNDQDKVAEFCEDLYEAAAKCETKHGFDNGLVDINGYENQIHNEYQVCNFIDSLVWESYDEKGEIMVGEVQDVVIRQLTDVQMGALALLCLTVMSIASYALYLHRKITHGFPQAQVEMVSSQGQLA